MIARGDGTPLYNLEVAVDDAEMEITDVVRGDDHLSNTPKQLLVLVPSGISPPRYAHLPLLHGPDGRKLSKRDGAASVQELAISATCRRRSATTSPCSAGGPRTMRPSSTTDELIERFSIERVGRSSAIFDERKLRWMNGRFMRELPLDEYEQPLVEHLRRRAPEDADAFAAASPERRRAACEIVQDKAQTLDEVWPLDPVSVRRAGAGSAAWDKVMTPTRARRWPRRSRPSAPWTASTPASSRRRFGPVVERSGRKPKAVFQPIRVAITGTTVSPGIFDSLAALGRDDSLRRIERGAGRGSR